jgi:hypothetical protein
MADERADPQAALILLEVVEPGDPVDVDERLGRRETELHQGNQALATGENFGGVTSLAQERERFLERPGRQVLEAGGVHQLLLSGGWLGPGRWGRTLCLVPGGQAQHNAVPSPQAERSL